MCIAREIIAMMNASFRRTCTVLRLIFLPLVAAEFLDLAAFRHVGIIQTKMIKEEGIFNSVQ